MLDPKQVRSIFPMPVAVIQLDVNSLQKEINFLKSLPMMCDQDPNAVSPDMSVNKRVLNYPQVASLKEIFRSYVFDFMYHVLAIDGEVAITQSWVNKNRPKEHTPSHMHSNSIVSGVFYLDVPNDAHIMFHKEAPYGTYVLDFPTNFERGNYSAFAHTYHQVNVTNGMLVLFPSMLYHSVPPNITGVDRYSLAFNSITKNQIGSDEDLNTIRIAEND
jgi:uncharacterized protein (TIGR02466 family)